MNGGRGAKGSINDRLISMMYKNRYKLAQQKKEGYTKDLKQEQKEYLKSIQNFDIEEDVLSLDAQDKEVVEEVFKQKIYSMPKAVGRSEEQPVSKEQIKSSPIAFFPEQAKTLEDTILPQEDNLEYGENLSEKVQADKVVPFRSSFEQKVSSIKEGAISIENSSQPDIASIHELSDKMIDVDINTEVFDFDNYDYYEVFTPRKGVADEEKTPEIRLLESDVFKDLGVEQETIDVEKEIQKVEDEEVILTELSTFIEESQVIIGEIKEELTDLKDSVAEGKTQQQVEQLEEKYASIRAKVDKLKEQYNVVKEKYDFEDFKILESIEMMEAIDDYRDKASLEELETMVDVCKTEIDQIDGILIEEKRSVAVKEDIEQQKKEVIQRDQDFSKNKEGVIYLDELEKRIAQEAREQAQIILKLEKELANFQTEVQTVTKTVYHTEKLFGSFLRIAAGILTMPFNGRNVFGTMLGSHLINRGMHQLRDSLNPEFVKTTEVKHRYRDIEREILNSKDYVKTTSLLIDDSIRQLDKFDEEFQLRFHDYVNLIPQYKEVEKQIEMLKKSLSLKKEEVKVMEKDLDRQYQENKVKVKKAS